MADLHVFTDDTDTVVAASLADAQVAYDEWAGGATGHDPEAWEQLPDDRPLTIVMEPGEKTEQRVTKTCAEWAASNGRGLLCSTEY